MTYEPHGTQIDVITSTAPVLVVRGGAGAGKTTTAVAAARAHLDSADRHLQEARRAAALSGQRTRLPAPQRALFLSFSRTAVAQILDRAGSVIGPHGSRLEVATFDGFAWRIINDFGARYGHPKPLAVIGAANRKVPGAPPGLTYDQLLPAARALLAVPKIADHYARRYGIVICDEFQDTDADEWAFLQAVAPAARRILLGDANQCIYSGFKPGVDPAARIAAALAIPGAIAIDLPAVSHRDPTGVLPAAADAARERRFDDPAIQAAASSERLTVTRIRTDGYAEVIALTQDARQHGHTVSVFTHTIAATAALSDALSQAGLIHEQVGFGEAYGEALAAQLALIQYALGHGESPRRSLAVFLAACHGGRALPPLARQLLHKANPALERAIGRLSMELTAAGGTEPDLNYLADVVSRTWTMIGTSRGQETWSQAAKRTARTLRAATDQTIATVSAELLRSRDEALVGNHTAPRRRIEVMNLHQTKGREADTAILLLGSDEYHGHESEPFPNGSRLLYVVMTRARQRAHIVVPNITHALWRPLVAACQTARESVGADEQDLLATPRPTPDANYVVEQESSARTSRVCPGNGSGSLSVVTECGPW